MFAEAYDQEAWEENAVRPVLQSGSKMLIDVTDEAGRVTWWEVSGRMVPEYIAQEVEG